MDLVMSTHEEVNDAGSQDNEVRNEDSDAESHGDEEAETVLSIEKNKAEFFDLPPHEILDVELKCAYQVILSLGRRHQVCPVEGDMYIFVHFICFFSYFLSQEVKKIIPFHRITSIKTEQKAGRFPVTIEIIAGDEEFFFATSDEEGMRLISDRWQKYRNGTHTISEEVRVYTASYSDSLCTPVWSTMEDVDPPDSFAVPETYTIVAEYKIPGSVEMMFNSIFVDSIRDQEEIVHKNCEDKDFKCSRWRPHDEFGFIRDISFKQYVNLTSDPISCSCKEVQKFRAYSNSCFVVITSQEIRSESDEYCFNVEGLLDVRRNSDESEDSCVLRIFIKLPIVEGNFGEGDIEPSILDDFRGRYGKWVEKGLDTVEGSLLDGQCLESGITRYYMLDGQGQDILNIDKQVALSYAIEDNDMVLFEGSLSNLAEKLNYNQEFAEAVMGLKLGSATTMVIPPSVNNSSEYTYIYININNDVEVSSDAGNSNSEAPSHENIETEVSDSLGFAKTILYTSRKIMGSNITYSRIAKTLGAGTLIICLTDVIMGLVRKEKTERYSRISSGIVNKIFKTRKSESIQQQAGHHPDITYRVIDDGKGNGLSKYQQGCFVYKKIGAVKPIFFEGSPTELAIHFIRGHEEAIESIRPEEKSLIIGFEEAIVGMKVNETRRITIPPPVSCLEGDTYVDLTLTKIKDNQPRKINFLASKM